MSRRDKIISLALSKPHLSSNQPISHQLNPNPSIINPAFIQKQPIITNLDLLWSRPLDFNNFKPIFDFKNEYSNSSVTVQNYDLTSFYENSFRTLVTRHSLTCYETLPSSEDESDNMHMHRAINYFEDSDDSVMDKDYFPDFIDSDSDSPMSLKHKKHAIQKHKETRRENIEFEEDERKETRQEVIEREETRSEQIELEEDVRKETGQEEIEREETRSEHIEFEKDFCEETGQGDIEGEVTRDEEGVRKETGQVEIEREKTEREETTREVTEQKKTDCEVTEREKTDREETECEDAERENIEVEEFVTSVNEKGLTKAGLPRKRRKYNLPLAERNAQKRENADEKLSLKPPCDDKCRKKCTTKISEEIRREIHDQYIRLNWESRGLFIKGMIEPKEIKTRTTKEGVNKNKREVSYYYHFQVKHEKIPVCKTFFLTTLGYNPQNNRHIHSVLSKDIDNQKDKRGSYERKNVIDKDLIKNHIQSFNPTISHYRREHAPNKLYLPSDMNITMMHQCFINIYPSMSISLETYRKVVKEMNISFAHLGHEECEQCALFESHTGCGQENCDLCIQNSKHKSRYTESREEYQRDKEQGLTDKDCIYFSVDLQKVIMLPRMDQFKTAIFCLRIITFNESFVPLGTSNGTNIPYAVLWNETVSGRSQEDIISAFRPFFLHKRDMKRIVLWADNCAAQNKNWAFMCFLVNIVNSNLIAAESITVKYFEPGHSFMSADHFHHQVEMALKKKNKVYDFDDFVDAVKMANSRRSIVKTMTVSDFYCYEDVSSQHRIRNIEPRVYLKDIMAVKAERGAFTIKYKSSHVSDWKELDFLQVKIIKNKCFPNISNKTSPRGITRERKDRIIADLVPLMPENRREFWFKLPETSRASNLD